MSIRKIYIIGVCVALFGSLCINSLLTCAMIASVLLVIPIHNEWMDIGDYYRMKYQDDYSWDEFKDEMFYKAFCVAEFIFVTTFIYSVCSM